MDYIKVNRSKSGGECIINKNQIVGFHISDLVNSTAILLTGGHKVDVKETIEEIKIKLDIAYDPSKPKRNVM